ncbi:zinc finger MYM-type protein 1-like [Dendrobium catenatum]|uniref:zinc finger MYM-type protein 1-like n=1 Tax=Dendrobium catenatum TaxID=906689 RepID=UPI00109F9B99|nr:zinc finger MYM-type protein 1-like [Dendrobium catenatum]
MERYLKRKEPLETDINNLPVDPGIRPSIWSYDVNERDKIRRAYLLKGPHQPKSHQFPQIVFGNLTRRFNPKWFEEYPVWLEYSGQKDAAFFLYCYLFKPQDKTIMGQGGGDSFIGEGFRNWKKKEKLLSHVREHNSAHNKARHKCEDLMKTKEQSLHVLWLSKDERNRKDYKVMLTATVDCVRFLLRQGLSFRGHDESSGSENRGNYLELFDFLSNHNDEIKKVSSAYSSSNLKLTSREVQKEICSAAVAETLISIMKDIGDSYYAILVDESHDVSTKEQLAVAVRYVDSLGQVVERFIGIKHVASTNTVALKEAMEDILAKHSLSIHRIRGQGYDGASNLRGEFHGLKALILNDNPHAFYVHYFAHQLQLCLVAVAKNHWHAKHLFEITSRIVNTFGASCKRSDALRAIQHDKIMFHLSKGELKSGRGLNQETSLQRAGDTRWGSHFHTLINLKKMYASVIEVLEIIKEDGVHDQQDVEAGVLINAMESFDFILALHLLIDILGVTNELSQALQRKDQDILNAMKLVQMSKQQLQMIRDNGWNSLLEEVSHFCNVFEVDVPVMSSTFKARRRSARRNNDATNLHHYRVEFFYTIIDMQLQELNNRFSEASTELLLCMSCLNSSNSFSAYNKEKLIRLAELYSVDFSIMELVALEHQLSTYILDMSSSEEFSSLDNIADLAKQFVKAKKDIVYPLVHRLLILALTLLIATATVERAFSGMKIVKHRLRSKMGDDWLSDCLVPYIEKEVFDLVPNEVVMQHYQKMQNRMQSL